ncbi:MAG: transposase [Candidatus Binatia bacterium]
MARKPRVEFEGAFYHVIVRGNQRQKIFRDDRDRLYYLKRVEHYRQRYGFIVYAYVLMSNHVHFLVETGKTPLSKILQGIQFTYTQYYNRRYGTVGHLFQGRYKAILCDRDAYLLELVRYIHLNPVRLKDPEDVARYRWSSHHVYLGRGGPVAVDTALVLEQLGKTPTQAASAYRRFIADGDKLGHDERYYQAVDQRFLGDEDFVHKILERAPQAEIRPGGRNLRFEKLLPALAQVHGCGVIDLTAAGRQRAWAKPRAQLAYLARNWCGMRATEIARQINRDASMVSRLCAIYETDRNPKTERKIAEVIDK